MIVGEEGIIIKPLYLILMKNNLGNCKQCKTFIKHHHVKVNQQIMTDVHYKVHCDDVIMVDDKVINTEPFVYYMMNKPKGYICAHHDQLHHCVSELIQQDDCYCVGRLDKDTTGFLLLTNDSSLSKRLLLPQHHVQKMYLVTTLYKLDDSLRERFQQGIIIDQDVQCLSSVFEKIDDYHCYVSLDEGKYHQVKKMFLSCHNEVKELKRVSFAGIELDPLLTLGEYRKLNKGEFQKLKENLSSFNEVYNELRGDE